MKGLITNLFIVLLVVLNVLVGVMNYRAGKPRCLCDECNNIRVSGNKYCHKHIDFDENEMMMLCLSEDEQGRSICLEVIDRK